MKLLSPVARLLTLAIILTGASVAQADPLNGVAKRLIKGLAELPSHKIAVLPFEYPDGGISSGSSIVSERLISCLAGRPHVQVVERQLLSRLSEEHKLEVSGLTAPAETNQLEKILAVDAVVTGTLEDVGRHTTEVRARLIQVGTGLVLATDEATITRTWTDAPVVPPTPPAQQASDEPVAPLLSVTSTDTLFAAAPATSTFPDTDSLIRDPLPPNVVEKLQTVYKSDPDPTVRAGALYAMGIVMERLGRRKEASQVYSRLIHEFPGNARLKSDSAGRLWAQTLYH